MLSPKPDLLEEVLRAEGLLSKTDWQKIDQNRRRLQNLNNYSFKEALLELKILSEREINEVISKHFKIPLAPQLPFIKSPLDLNLPVKFLRNNLLYPFKITENQLHMAVSNYEDSSLFHDLLLTTGFTIIPYLAPKSEILEALDRVYSLGGESSGTVERIEDHPDNSVLQERENDEEYLQSLASDAPIIKIVDSLISRAVEQNASDVHLEPYESRLAVRFRIDGVLRNIEDIPIKSKSAIVSRIKIMSNLDISEHRLPQDGRSRLKIFGKKVDLRVSIVPTSYGESVVFRILDQENIFNNLRELGFSRETQQRFEKLIKKPNGFIIVGGPTGAGKTTTLYAALQELNRPDKKIITVEDPIEYQMEGITQIQVQPKIGLTFANGLRSIVRQDPDIILIGEIRDSETAEISLQSALTGHLVLSSLHINDAHSAITRLLDMGVERYLLTSCLEGVLSQRLVRIICKYCKTSLETTSTHFPEMMLKGREVSSLWHGKGCENCGGTGYLGRTGIYEFLHLDDELKQMIAQGQDDADIRVRSLEKGMTSLLDDGWEKVKQGITTPEEILRVFQEYDLIE